MNKAFYVVKAIGTKKASCLSDASTDCMKELVAVEVTMWSSWLQGTPSFFHSKVCGCILICVNMLCPGARHFMCIAE